MHRERVGDQGVEEVLFAVGESFIQLLGALGPDTPVGRFLERRGPGVHHVGYRVPDVALALQDLRAEGVTLIDEHPRLGSRGTTIAFVHPKDVGGVLVELVQETRLSRTGSRGPRAGALMRTETLPSGSAPSPISWCATPASDSRTSGRASW